MSIPAEARARWMADKAVVVGLGDRVGLRPRRDDPVGALRGKYRGRGPEHGRGASGGAAEDERRDRLVR